MATDDVAAVYQRNDGAHQVTVYYNRHARSPLSGEQWLQFLTLKKDGYRR